MKYLMINEVVINLSQVQTVERHSSMALMEYGVKVTFVNGKETIITTNTYDYLFEGRFTKAKEEEYLRKMKRWQETIITLLFKKLQEFEIKG